jgi:hypothetical protein
MIARYLKIWFKVITKNNNLNDIAKSAVIHMLYFGLIFLLTNFRIGFSIFIFILFILFKLISRLILLQRELVNSGKYDLLLLQPIDPLWSLIIYNKNPADILLLFPVLLFISVKNYKNK